MNNCKALIIGGSAGSLDVLLKLLPDIDSSLHLPIIIVLHRKSGKESLLTHLLSNKTTISVKEIKENTYPSSRLIVGPGGIGKSSLCMALVKQLNDGYKDKNVLLIMSENIRLSENIKSFVQNNAIDSLYKLYYLYMNLITFERYKNHLIEIHPFLLNVL